MLQQHERFTTHQVLAVLKLDRTALFEIAFVPHKHLHYLEVSILLDLQHPTRHMLIGV